MGDTNQNRTVVEPPPISDPRTADELVRHRLEQQELLAQFGLSALRSRDTGTLLQDATRLAARGMGVKLCKALEFKPDLDKLLVVAGVGWGRDVVGNAMVGADLASPAGFALKSGQPVVSNHLENEERFRTPKLLVEHGIHRAINVLIQAYGQHWGVLEVDSPDEGRFEAADIPFLQGFANIIGVALERSKAEADLRAAVAHQELLVKETSHRVKNSLAMVSSLLQLQMREAKSEETIIALREASARIASISQAHDQLWRTPTDGALELDVLIKDVCRHLREQAPRITLAVRLEPVTIDSSRAIAAALLTTELVTNAQKYAYPDGTGEIKVTLTRQEMGFSLEIADKGHGLPADFSIETVSQRSLGMRMVQSLVRQLRGNLSIEKSVGTSFRLIVPDIV